MKKPLIFILSLFFSLLLLHNSWGYGVDGLYFADGSVIAVEVASSPAELQRGLMYRDSLPANTGMLFVFESEDAHGFWMKNMNFPIDIIWLDSDLKVVDVAGDVPPCLKEPCEIYTPSEPARYVLEAPAGFALENGVEVGHGASLIQGGVSQ